MRWDCWDIFGTFLPIIIIIIVHHPSRELSKDVSRAYSRMRDTLITDSSPLARIISIYYLESSLKTRQFSRSRGKFNIFVKVQSSFINDSPCSHDPTQPNFTLTSIRARLRVYSVEI